MKHIGEPVATILRELAARVERNVPHHRDPERFHIEKSEIAADLRRLARRDPRHAHDPSSSIRGQTPCHDAASHDLPASPDTTTGQPTDSKAHAR